MRELRASQRAGRAAALLGLPLLSVAGCAAPAGGPGGTASVQQAAAGRSAVAAGYLAIALPANRRLETEVDSYASHRNGDLTVAESALRAEAATEGQFDRALLRISFPPPIAATARDLVRANQRRIAMTERQAQAASIPALLAFTGQHQAADAAVEVQVRLIRRELGLPPPETS